MNEYLDVSFIKINILPCQNMKILRCLNLSNALSMTTWARYFINLLNLHRCLETLPWQKWKNQTLIELKSDNLQHNTLGCWDKQLIDQVSDVPSIIFLLQFLLIIVTVSFSMSFCSYLNHNKSPKKKTPSIFLAHIL